MPSGPFVYRRRVGFGECDAARIYFAPRAIDYAVEAVEAWFGAELGVSWPELYERHGLDATVRTVECDFLRSLVAGQVVRVRVAVSGCDAGRISFLAAGEVDSGPPYLNVRLEVCFTDRKSGETASIPPEYRGRVEAYRDRWGGDAVEGDRPAGATPGPEEPRRLAPPWVPPSGGVPFVVRRRVVYGECGASGTVYAPKVFEFLIEAVGEWYEEIPGVSWMDLIAKLRKGAPWVTAVCDYLRPVACGREVAMAVRLTRVGRSSLGFAVTGYGERGEPCFDARLTACFIDQDAGSRPMPIPQEYRGRIEAYRAACGAKGAGEMTAPIGTAGSG